MVEIHRFHGPPGCGKTSKVAQWAKRAIEKFGGDRVLLCSLTRAAAHELKRQGLDVPDENVGTLHSLCLRALGRPTLHVDHIADWNERHPRFALTDATSDDDDLSAGVSRSDGLGDKLEQATSVRRAKMTPRKVWLRDELDFDAKWTAWKSDLGVVDFTDLLEDVLAGDVPPPPSDVVFYDEAQDGSALEHAIIRRWAEGAQYAVLAGDCDQLLFRWRGADPDVFLAPLPEGPGAEHPLVQSFRVPEAVRAHASAWIAGCTRRFAVEYRARREDPLDPSSPVAQGALLRPELSMRDEEIAELVEAELAAVPGRVFLLASCGFLLTPALQAMRARGIPFACPYRTKQGAWNPMRGTRRLADFLVPARTGPDGARRLWTAPELWSWVEHASANGLVRRGMKTALEDAAREAKKNPRARPEPLSLAAVNSYLNGEPLREVGSLLDAAARTGDLRPALAWIGQRVLSRHARAWEYGRAVAARGGVLALLEEPRVVVGTCHATKGAEGDSVILSPDVSPAGSRAWSGDADARDDVRRTFYVGMTRARERLSILRSASGWPCAIPI